MNKIFKVFCFGVFILLQSPLQSSPNIYKGETEFHSVSPFLMLQEKDTILLKRYQEIKSLHEKKEYSKSLEKALNFYNEVSNTGNKEFEYLSCYLIGEIFQANNNQSKALEFYKKSLQIITNETNIENKESIINDFTSENKIHLVKSLLKIGATYHKLAKKDTAVLYYKKIENIQSFNIEIESVKAAAYNNLSGIYLVDSLYDKAKIYALKAVEIRKKTNNKISEAAALSNLASISLEQGNYEDAKITYSKAIDLIENDSTTTAVKYKEGLYYNLAWTLFLLKDYMAYDYQEKSYLIKDNLRDQNMRRIVDEVYAKNQIDLKNKQIELEKAEEKRTTIYLSIVFLLFVIAFGVIIYNYKLRQGNLKLKLTQNELSQQSKIEKLKSDAQIRILNATLDGKESERKQIAETLHDSVSTLLSSANLHIQASKSKFKDKAIPEEIEKSQNIITEASQKIRDLSHTLVSSVLLKFGLEYAINEMEQKFSNSSIKIETITTNIKRYPQNFEIKVNNIIQEFVNNILKHSKASYAKIQVEDENNQLHILIEDNGCGFDKNGITKKDGLGINQIEARIQMMKGSLNIDSKSSGGTKIMIVLPIDKKATNLV